MVVAYVRLCSSQSRPTAPSHRAIFALLLPDVNGSCDEVDVRQSHIAGFGVFPVDWNLLGCRVLLPYLGARTVVSSERLLRTLVRVLQGQYSQLTVGDLSRQLGYQQRYVADALFAVPQCASTQQCLPMETALLHVGRHYLIEDEVWSALHLDKVAIQRHQSLATVRFQRAHMHGLLR